MKEALDLILKKYKYPMLCQCGGELVTEHTIRGHLQDEHDGYRVHCRWCPASSRWLTSEYDCLMELINGMGERRKSKRHEKSKRLRK